MILSFLTGTIGRYLVLAVVAVGFLAWIRADAAAPYKAEVTALREAAARKEAIIKADAARAEADSSEIARLNATLESVLHEHKMSSCKLSPAELVSLRSLASGNR